MKIGVIGLGIIGGSLAAALSATKKYRVDGWNRNEKVTEYAFQNGYIQGEITDFSEYEIVLIALPPQITMSFLDEKKFKDNAIVADICGVKEIIEKAVYAKERNYRYVGCHPMAGKEVCGIENASATLFQNASLILTRCKYTDENAFAQIKKLGKEMLFGRIIECDAKYHDKKIPLTSQLAHIVSNAYVKSSTIEGYQGFTGGSFQDMTRIAAVDENIWTQLYLDNRENILQELNILIENLSLYRDALSTANANRLKELLKDGRIVKESFLKKGRDL